MRVLVGVGAWFLGVGAATGGSLLAVSLLGQGIAASNNTQQLTQAAVTRALASEATETTQPGLLTASGPAATPSGTRSPRTHPPTTPPPQVDPPSDSSASARPSSTHHAHATATPTPAATANATPTPSPTQSAPTTALTSQGGTVVAECLPGGAYLLSWSPTQGYEAGPVVRGPAATAQVTFESTANTVVMVVSCSTGVPTATTTVNNGGSGGPSHTDE
jgi:hypothetical protein